MSFLFLNYEGINSVSQEKSAEKYQKERFYTSKEKVECYNEAKEDSMDA